MQLSISALVATALLLLLSSNSSGVLAQDTACIYSANSTFESTENQYFGNFLPEPTTIARFSCGNEPTDAQVFTSAPYISFQPPQTGKYDIYTNSYENDFVLQVFRDICLPEQGAVSLVCVEGEQVVNRRQVQLQRDAVYYFVLSRPPQVADWSALGTGLHIGYCASCTTDDSGSSNGQNFMHNPAAVMALCIPVGIALIAILIGLVLNRNINKSQPLSPDAKQVRKLAVQTCVAAAITFVTIWTMFVAAFVYIILILDIILAMIIYCDAGAAAGSDNLANTCSGRNVNGIRTAFRVGMVVLCVGVAVGVAQFFVAFFLMVFLWAALPMYPYYMFVGGAGAIATGTISVALGNAVQRLVTVKQTGNGVIQVLPSAVVVDNNQPFMPPPQPYVYEAAAVEQDSKV